MERALNLLNNNWPILVLLVILAAAFVIFRTSPSDIADETAFDLAIHGGRPTIVELYSNF
jgi:hypothetical protein